MHACVIVLTSQDYYFTFTYMYTHMFYQEIEHRFIKIHSAPVIAAAGRPLPLSRTSSTPEGPRRSTTSGHPLMFQSHVGKRVCPPMGGAEPSFSLDSLQIKERKRQDNMMNNETGTTIYHSCSCCKISAST